MQLASDPHDGKGSRLQMQIRGAMADSDPQQIIDSYWHLCTFRAFPEKLAQLEEVELISLLGVFGEPEGTFVDEPRETKGEATESIIACAAKQRQTLCCSRAFKVSGFDL